MKKYKKYAQNSETIVNVYVVVQRKYGEKCRQLLVKGDVMIYLAKKSLMDGIFGTDFIIKVISI